MEEIKAMHNYVGESVCQENVAAMSDNDDDDSFLRFAREARVIETAALKEGAD